MASDWRTISWGIFKCIYNQWRKEVKAGGDRDFRGVGSQWRQEVFVQIEVWVLERHWRVWRSMWEPTVRPRPLDSHSVANGPKLVTGGQILVTVKKDWQGLDLPAHMKWLENGTKYMKLQFLRNWASDNEGKWSLRDGNKVSPGGVVVQAGTTRHKTEPDWRLGLTRWSRDSRWSRRVKFLWETPWEDHTWRAL